MLRFSFHYRGETCPAWLQYVLIAIGFCIGLLILHAKELPLRFYIRGFISTIVWITAVVFTLKRICSYPRPCFFTKYCKWEDGGCVFENDQKRYTAFSSFPSGHASSSAAAFGFLFLFLEKRLNEYDRLALLFLCMGLTFFIGISRIVNRMHHPADVGSGYVLGLLVAVINNNFVVNLGNQQNKDADDHEVMELVEKQEASGDVQIPQN